MNEEELPAISIEEELRLLREWEAVKEKARRKVFDEVRREQDRRMLFAFNLRESFGLKVSPAAAPLAPALALSVPIPATSTVVHVAREC